MKKRMMSERLKDVYGRIWISFSCILILPIIVFSILFVDVVCSTFENKLIEQMKENQNNIRKEIEKELNNIRSVALYNSQLGYMQDYMLEKDYQCNEIKLMLAAETEKKELIKKIIYYTDATPKNVYTADGILSSEYFAKKYMEEENIEQLLTKIEEGEVLGLCTKETASIGQKDGSSEIYYIVKFGKGKIWIFNLSQLVLDDILGNDNKNRVILNSEGTQLFPFVNSGDQNSEDYHRIISISSEYSFQVVENLDMDKVSDESQGLKTLFVVIVVIVIIMGSAIIILLSNFHMRPIKELNDYCNDKFEDIPDTIGGYDVFKFAINEMERYANISKMEQKKDNLLTQILLGWEIKSDDFYKELKNFDLFQATEKYTVLVASIKSRYAEKLQLYFDTELNTGYEFHELNFIMNDKLVFLVGISRGNEGNFKAMLSKTTEFFHGSLDIELKLYFGELSDNIIDVNKIFKNIIRVVKADKNNFEENVIFCKTIEDKDDFIYPDNELAMLYEAVKQEDIEKVNLMLNILIKILSQCQTKPFFYRSIYREILGIFGMAFEKKKLSSELIYKEREEINAENVEGIILIVQELERTYINNIKKERKNEGDYLVLKVLEYIEENIEYREMNVNMIAEHFCVSASNLSHQFKLYTNNKISEYILMRKLERAKEMLKNTDYRISEIAELLGYSQTSSFIRTFKHCYGITPAEYRNYNIEI